MEEKLYFKPGNYGKGTKKKKKRVDSERKPDSAKPTNSEKNHRALNLILFLLFIVIVVLIVLWLLRGKTTTTGQYPANIKNESLECSATNLIYEKTSRIKPKSEETRIVTIFYGEEDLSSINFRHTMYFDSKEQAAASEAIAHVEFAEKLATSGLSYEAFSNKFTRIDSNLVLSLYSSEKLKQESAYEYFLIKKLEDIDRFPSSLGELRENYESQGFVCKSSLDKQ